MVLSLLGALVLAGGGGDPAAVEFGTSRVDVSPSFPVRLSGYGNRRDEATEVAGRLWARALALRRPEGEPLLWVAVENTGLPRAMVEAVARRVSGATGLARERMVFACTHTHTGPSLQGNLPTLFGVDIPPEHQAHIDRYTRELAAKIEQAALAALSMREPGRLAWGEGRAGFAANRRTAGGPVDPSLPLLAVLGADGAPRATLVNYACHCTTLDGGFNQVHGDWAGVASGILEREHPGCVALVTIGCGADANPSPRTGLPFAEQHGAEVAAEVQRLLGQGLHPLPGALRARLRSLDLPFAPLPDEAEWKRRAGAGGAVAYHARRNLRRLAEGEALPTTLPYTVQSFSIGDEVASVFLAGEVVVDYATRVERDWDASRVWVCAYANDVPCYIPSRRILAEGGYEAEGAMVYYDQPTRLDPSVEERIHAAIEEVLDPAFRPERTPTPEASRRRMVLAEGHEVQLVAAEPDVLDPVAIDFGADGRLWVLEMRDYPEGMGGPPAPDGQARPGGRVRVLEAVGADGRAGAATVFADDLPFPTGLMAWGDGVLVCAAPDLLWLRDTDGDGRADRREVLLTGFATHNFQARLNGPRWGLDGGLHFAGGLFGGEIRVPARDEVVDLRGRDLRWDPRDGSVRAVAGISQQGRVCDDFGRWFGCDNSHLAFHFPLDDVHLARNPHLRPPPPARDIAPESRLHPIGAPRERFNDPSHGARVTSACGIEVLRSPRFGTPLSVFTCEPAHGLVHRRLLIEQGSSFRTERPEGERDREFLASSDPWFAPVQARTGPDGTLWIVDMARRVVEHPIWIAPERLESLDVRAGEGLGRIWRVVPVAGPTGEGEGGAGTELRSPLAPGLGALDWVALHDHPSGTVRDLAQRALVLQVPRGGVGVDDALAKVARSGRAAGRAAALATLHLRGALHRPLLDHALQDEVAGVRCVAVRITATRAPRPPAFGILRKLLDDLDPFVMLELAASLGAWAGVEAGGDLGRLLVEHGEDPYLEAAVLSWAPVHLGDLLREVAAAGEAGEARLGALVEQCAALEDRSARAVLVGLLPDLAPPVGFEVLGALARGGALDPAPEVASLLQRAREVAADPTAPRSLRLPAIAALAAGAAEGAGAASSIAVLCGLLDPARPLEVQLQAVATLGGLRAEDGAQAAAAMLAGWRAHSPPVRSAVLEALLSRPAWTAALLEAAAADGHVRAGLDLLRRERLREHPDPVVRTRAREVLDTAVSADRAAVIERYSAAASLPADPVQGAALFTEHCASCHRLGGVGRVLGPDLDALTDRSFEALRIAVFDPDRAVLDQYRQYQVFTRDGRNLAGLIDQETSTSFRLTDQDGEGQVLLRQQVDELRSTGRSMMPRGLEEALTPAQFAHLVAFVQRSQPRRQFEGNNPRVLVAGAGEVVLDATSCELHGSQIVFETPFQNLGYWHGADDCATWTLELAEARTGPLELDCACPDASAGHPFVLEVDGREVLRGVAPATGGWDRYRTLRLGELSLGPGRHRLRLRPLGDPPQALFDLRALRWIPPEKSVP